MSDLVEKVKAAIDGVEAIQNDFGDWHDDMDGEARAAIRAVLAHFAEAGNVTEAMCEVVDKATADEIHKQQDGESWVLWIRRLRQTAIAAAMAAALKEMEKEPKP